MASGKSTVGRLLAQRLGYAFVDLDAEVEAAAGKKVAEIFRDSGEEAFRLMEEEALRRLSSRTGIVLASGGGAPLRESNRDFFRRDAASFYLEVSLGTALTRAAAERGARPLLERDADEIKKLYESRLFVYGELGRRVRTENKSPRDVAEKILSLLRATKPGTDPGHRGG